MRNNKLRFLDKRLMSVVAALGLSLPLMAQDAEKIAEETISKEAPALNAERSASIEEIIKQQHELEADHLVLEAEKSLRHSLFEEAEEQFTEAKQKYQKVSKSEPSILQKIAAIDKKLALVLKLHAEQLVKEAKINAGEKSLGSFDKALDKLKEAKTLDPRKTEEVDLLVKKIEKDRADFEHELKVGKEQLNKDYRGTIDEKGDLANEILFERAQILFASKRYIKCRATIDQILLNHPYHKDAVKLLQQVNKRLYRSANIRRESIYEEFLAEVEWKWSEPISIYSPEDRPDTETTPETADQRGGIYELLRIRIPKVPFVKRDLSFVVDFLKRITRDLSDDGRSLNVIIAVDDNGGAAPDAAADEGGDDFEDFDDGDFGDEPDAAPAAEPSSSRTITLEADDMPVGEVIEYICDQLNLKFKIEEHAVIIGDTQKFLDLETEIIPIPTSLLEIVETRRAEAVDGGLLGGGGDEDGQDFQGFFQELGITFPPGSKINYIESNSRLVMKNTPDNIEKLKDVIRNVSTTPQQISIESKFIEVQNTSTQELGVAWNVGRPNNLNVANGINHQRLNLSTTVPNVLGDPNSNPTPDNPNLGTVSSGAVTRSTLATSLGNGIRDITAVVAGQNGALGAQSGPFQAGVNLILGDYVFQGLIRALDQENTEDVLSAPQVTAMSGQTAIIRVVQERYFPESWDQADLVGAAVVIGTSPEFGEPRDIGIVLEVTPQAEPDGRTISLELKPQVLQFVQYDTAFNDAIALPGAFGGGTLAIIYSMPILSARTIETRVSLWNGETIMLGGLVRETVTAIDDRVPYLSDLPMIGRFFQNKGQQAFKQNLLVFVTARLVGEDGVPKEPREDHGLPDFKRL